MIGVAVDGNLETFADDEHLTWMPAHQLFASIGNRQLSHGTLLTAVDWRSKRLAAVLAKQAAATRGSVL